MSTIYVTDQWNGFGKQNYYWNEYRSISGEVVKYKCNKRKHFDGDENAWTVSEEMVESWKIDDPNMPEWLKQYI